MEDKNTIKVSLGTVVCIFIIILLIVALGVFYYFGFVKNKEEITALKDKVNTLDNKNTIQSEKVETKTSDVNSNNVQSSKNESKDISVADAVNHEYSTNDVTFKVKLPKIVGKSTAIDELNKEILNKWIPGTYSAIDARKENKAYFSKGLITTYRYIIKNNILVIYVYDDVPEGGSGIPATNNGIESNIYCYDIENDKVLTIEETAKKLNLNANEYLEGIPDYYSIYKQLDKDTPIVKVDGSRFQRLIQKKISFKLIFFYREYIHY